MNKLERADRRQTRRVEVYLRDRRKPTPAQSRRYNKKENRLKALRREEYGPHT